MRFRRRRDIPQLSSSSMADIAFLLLTFFLLTSSLESDTGFYRHLSPSQIEDILTKKKEIEEENLLIVSIDAANALAINEEAVSVKDVRPIAKAFIADTLASERVIQLIADRATTYESYISVLNELNAAYNELRETFAQQQFGKALSDLSEEQRETIRAAYPVQISEKETANNEEDHE